MTCENKAGNAEGSAGRVVTNQTEVGRAEISSFLEEAFTRPQAETGAPACFRLINSVSLKPAKE